MQDRQLPVGDELAQLRIGASPVLLHRLLIGQLQSGQVKNVDLVLGQMLLTEGDRPAQEIVVDIVPVDQIVVILHHAQLAQDLHIRAQLFL